MKKIIVEDYKTDISFRNLAVKYAKRLKKMIGEVGDIKKTNKYDIKLSKKYIYFKDPDLDLTYFIGSAKNEPQVKYEKLGDQNTLLLFILPQGMINNFNFKKYDSKIVYRHIELRENLLVNAFTKFIDRTRAKDVTSYKPKIFSVKYTAKRNEEEEYNPFFQQFVDMFWTDVVTILKEADGNLEEQIEKFNKYIGKDYSDFVVKAFKKKKPIFMPHFKKYFDGLEIKYKKKMLRRFFDHYINGFKIINGEEIE